MGKHNLSRDIRDSLRSRVRARTTGLRRRCRHSRAARQDYACRQVAFPRMDPALRTVLGDDQGAIFPSLLPGAAVQFHADRDYIESHYRMPPIVASR